MGKVIGTTVMCTSSCWLALLRGPGALLVILFYGLLFGGGSTATPLNRTIDDVFGDSETGQRPIFLPTTTGVWKNQTCSDCVIRPNINQAFRNTYTSATYHPELGSVNVTLDFHGTAIYVFFILANNAGESITSNTNCTFKLDGQNVGSFLHEPDLTTTDVEFNTLVFSKTNIPFGQHRLVVATEDLELSAYMNFDYALYTFDDEPLPSSPTAFPAPSFSIPPNFSGSTPPQSNGNDKPLIAGAIAGSVIGGLACIAIIGILYRFYWRRKKITPRINLLEPRDDVPGSKGEGLPIYHTNRHEAPTAATNPTFSTAGTHPSGQPSTEFSARSRTEETSEYKPVIYAPHPQTTISTTSLHVANPGPDSPLRYRVNSIRQDGLKKHLVGLRGEHKNLKANLVSGTQATPQKQLPPPPTDSSYNGQTTDRGYMADASVAELRKEIQFLADQIADLRAQQLVQKSPDGSPPGYTLSMNNLPDIPFSLDQKIP